MRTSVFGLILWALAAFSLAGEAVAQPNAPVTRKTLGREIVARGLEHPWGMEFLPEGRLLVTERPGRLRIVAPDWKVSPPVGGVPKVYAEGQGGLLDVAASPDFASTGLIFLSFAEETAGGLARTAVARGRLEGGNLADVRVIFRQEPAHSGSAHFGSRLAFDREGNLFVTAGDRFSYRHEAQASGVTVGKIVRIRPDGSIPADNPLPDSPIWSLGHRNVQGAAINPATGELWTTEHGPQGGDEVNVVRAGRNYGWPVVTYGVEYVIATKIGEGARKEGIEDAVLVWTPSIAPSGMAFYKSAKHPEWSGSLFVAALKYEMLVRLTLDGDRVVGEERLSPESPRRLRDVAEGPDGSLYVITDEDDGEIWRVFPKRR